MGTDFGLDLLVQLRRSVETSQFFLSHFQVGRWIGGLIDGADGENEVVEIADNFVHVLVVFGFVAMFEKRAHHPDVCELRVDFSNAIHRTVWIGWFGSHVVRAHVVVCAHVTGSSAALTSDASGPASSL